MSDTLIVGFVGFLGVMVTLSWNARQQRQLEERRECREAMGLRKALIEELKQQRAALRETADSLAARQLRSALGLSGLEKQGQPTPQFRSDRGLSSLLSVMTVFFEFRLTKWAS